MEASFNYECTDTTQNNVYQDLSAHLYRVLDVVGVSEEVREGYREKAIVGEILRTVYKKTRNCAVSVYIFGSQYEGTTTQGLCSDADALFCDESLPVVESIDDAPLNGKALLMLCDDTKPGYVKLQSVVNKTKQTINERDVTTYEDMDHQGRILQKHVFTMGNNVERRGPADNIPASESSSEKDIVYAYRCRNIQSFTGEWLQRNRPYHWPSQEQIQSMGSNGCFVVGVAHPNSLDKEMEWRVSFSLQERDLMSSLNPTQHKCYVLLKMIKNDIIQPIVGKSLTSYHCKTCIFYLAEKRGVEHWTPNNLISCILECLRLLLDWVTQKKCPNYFIKDENMFDKLNVLTLKSLSVILQELLSNGVQFLYEIKCDDLGNLFALNISDKDLDKRKLVVKQHYGYCLYRNMTMDLLNARADMQNIMYKISTRSERAYRAVNILQYLEHTSIITEHDSRDVRKALDRLIPYIRFFIVQMKCSNGVVRKNKEEIEALAREIQLCMHCDLIASRLIVASVYFQCNKLDSCQEIFQNCENSLKPNVTSVCACHDYLLFTCMNKPPKEKLVAENISFEDFRRKYTASCMVFLPSEANLVPPALRYEMYRSVYTPKGTRHEITEFWFDWIVVDSKVYMCLLQYSLYNKTNKLSCKQDAIDNLQHLIDTDKNLGHRETALNVLGWIYTQENRVKDAFVCFQQSLAIRPLDNAAKWHIVIFLHSIIDI